MSRTYRTHLGWRYRAHGRDWTWEEMEEFVDSLGDRKGHWWIGLGWNGHNLIERRCRDRKPWDKPSREFKAMNRRVERARVADAIRNGRDIPLFKKSDQWDWT